MIDEQTHLPSTLICSNRTTSLSRNNPTDAQAYVLQSTAQFNRQAIRRCYFSSAFRWL